MILKCIYTVIGKDSQVGRRRSTGHEAMLKMILSNNLAMLLTLAIGL